MTTHLFPWLARFCPQPAPDRSSRSDKVQRLPVLTEKQVRDFEFQRSELERMNRWMVENGV